jgi:hypothetical protein
MEMDIGMDYKEIGRNFTNNENVILIEEMAF